MKGHTPGPWTVGQRRRACVDINGSWERLATVVVRMEGENANEPEGEANAKLIAAAPELAEALERLFMVHAPPTCTHAAGEFCEWCAARAALREAGRLP